MPKITTHTDIAGRLYATVHNDDGTTREFRTAPDGTGLWAWRTREVEWKQIEGTGQFSARNRADLARRIRRTFVA